MIKLISDDPKGPNITFLRILKLERLRTEVMRRANKFLLVDLELANRLFLHLGQILRVIYQGSTKINNLTV